MAMPMPAESNSSPPQQTLMAMATAEPSTNHEINQNLSNPEAMSYVVQQNPVTSTNHGVPSSTVEPLVTPVCPEGFVMRPVFVPTNQSVPVPLSGNEPGATHMVLVSDLDPSRQQEPLPPSFNRAAYVPLVQQQQHTNSLPQLNQSIPASSNEACAIEVVFLQDPSPQPPHLSQFRSLNQVVYVPQDQPRTSIQQIKSWPQAKQSHLQNVIAVAEPSEDQQEPEVPQQTTPDPTQVMKSTLTDAIRNPLPGLGAKNLKRRVGGRLANTAGNLANLLPTGTVLAFQAIAPSLSNSGKCESMNKYMVGFTIVCCAIACVVSSFTDSYVGSDGKLYYGFVTCKGLHVFNREEEVEEDVRKKLSDTTYKVRGRDFVHALGSLLVFMIFAISSSQVVDCFFPGAGDDHYSVIIYLPLVAGILSSCLFTVFPTARKGIGYAASQ